MRKVGSRKSALTKKGFSMGNPNNLELHKGDQFIIGLDISASMTATDTPNGSTRYAYCVEQCQTFCKEAANWDPDGVSFYLFGAKVHEYPDTTQDRIEALISKPSFEGMTRTELVIQAAYREHKSKNANGDNQTFFMCFTDGAPADPAAVQKTIIDITNDVKDEKEFRIQLLIVGSPAPDLSKWLTALDDDLTKAGAKYDIVDVKNVMEVDFLAACAGALTD